MKTRFDTGGKSGLPLALVVLAAGALAGCNRSIDALRSIDASGSAGGAPGILAAGGAGGGADAGAGGGAQGGAGGDTVLGPCDQIAAMYDAALPSAKSCSTAATSPPCQTTVFARLGCECKTFVDDDTVLTALGTQWEDAGCTRPCPFDCPALASGRCNAGAGAAGTCEDVP
jgi:hypothetical protein